MALSAYFWNRPYTGSGQYTRQLVYHLHKLVSDLEITLVCPLAAGESPPENVPEGVKVEVVRLRPGHLGKVWFEQVDFPRVCRRLGATVAHVPYWGAPLRSPVPLVVTIHDLTTLQVREYRRGLGARLYNALVSASARGADRVITDSAASQQAIIQHLGIPQDRVTVIYLAADGHYRPAANSLVDQAVLRKYNLPAEYVLYLGGYETHKNVTTLLLAYTYVAQGTGETIPLVLAGRRPATVSDHFPDYDAYIQRLGLAEVVRWIGFVDEAEKPVVYRHASAFVFPSRNEGFGLPPLEAMASGVPVIVSDGDSLSEVVGAAGFTVDPDDERAMAGAILAALVQEELAADMRRKGLVQAAQFSWDKTATQTALLYSRVIGNW
ncbi:MAG: glycosyltransferase family 1 protein [Chloroflexota bacterium]